MRLWKGILSVAVAGAMCGIPMWAAPDTPQNAPVPRQPAGPQQQSRQAPEPGMVNYVEGQASINGQALNSSAAGQAAVETGQTLATQNGKVEMLLSPGTILRLNDNSSVRMDSNSLGDVRVSLMNGRAMVESDQLLKDERMVVNLGPSSVLLKKNGLYDFDASTGHVRVFDGVAEVTMNSKTYAVHGGHEFDLNASHLKARGFDKKKDEDAFYRWSSLRSSYLAEANADAARGFANGSYGAAFYGGYPYNPGWFWDPYFDAYTWLPWDGYFFSPFGFGFYSPGFAFAAPFYGYGGFGGYRHFGPGYRAPVVTGGVRGGGFANGFGQVRGGGFRGGVPAGGGFHGGGFAGGGVRGGGFAGGFGGRR